MCKCVPYLIIVCDMRGRGSEGGSDGDYATVYCRCSIFYVCVSQYPVVYLKSFIPESGICRLFLKNVLLMMSRMFYFEPFFIFRHVKMGYLSFISRFLEWNPSFFLFVCFLSHMCEPADCFGSVWQSQNTAWDCRHSGLTASVLCHFPLGVTFHVGFF